MLNNCFNDAVLVYNEVDRIALYKIPGETDH